MSKLLWFVIGGITTAVGMGVAALALDDSDSSESDETGDTDDNDELEVENSKSHIDPKDILFVNEGDATEGTEGTGGADNADGTNGTDNG